MSNLLSWLWCGCTRPHITRLWPHHMSRLLGQSTPQAVPFWSGNNRYLSIYMYHFYNSITFNLLSFSFSQSVINTDIEKLPVNEALLQLLGNPIPTVASAASVSNQQQNYQKLLPIDQHANYLRAKSCIEELALYLKPCQITSTAGIQYINFKILNVNNYWEIKIRLKSIV